MAARVNDAIHRRVQANTALFAHTCTNGTLISQIREEAIRIPYAGFARMLCRRLTSVWTLEQRARFEQLNCSCLAADIEEESELLAQVHIEQTPRSRFAIHFIAYVAYLEYL